MRFKTVEEYTETLGLIIVDLKRSKKKRYKKILKINFIFKLR